MRAEPVLLAGVTTAGRLLVITRPVLLALLYLPIIVAGVGIGRLVRGTLHFPRSEVQVS